jgi:ssDNA-binding Zn-finger/Zn-ribbon topoisomerase 1
MSEKTKAAPATAERPCPECGEMVRPGLVRCWNCGGFMNRELEKKYQEMQAAPKKVFFSQLPDDADIHEAPASDPPEEDYVLTPNSPPPAPAGGGKKGAPKTGSFLDDAPDASDAPAPALAKSPPPAPAAPPQEGGVSHSVATGGDALLDIAMSEETELKKKRRSRPSGPLRTATGFIIFCPYGCKVEVKDQHRGMTGKCPKCRAPFIVPTSPPDYDFAKEREKSVAQKAAETSAPGGFVAWMHNVHVHTVSPTKLKLKEGSLVKDFAPYEFGFGAGKLLVASLAAKKGGLLGGKKGGPDPREEMLAHLRDGKPPEDLPVAAKKVYSADDARQIRVVWPEASRASSAFHGVPVFGKQMIAVQLPLLGDGDPQYASFTLSQFREFNRHLEELFGIEGLAANLGIPMTDEFVTSKDHYTDAQIKALKHPDWYLSDTAHPPVLAGYKCESCGATVSEASRKKEKLGGANGKGIAKATCPKCKKKMGNKPLYTLAEVDSGQSLGPEK